MKVSAYTIYDSAIQNHGQPFFARANGEAIRIFMDEATNTQSKINKHSKDFDLYKIGEYDDESGELINLTNERIARATDYTEAK